MNLKDWEGIKLDPADLSCMTLIGKQFRIFFFFINIVDYCSLKPGIDGIDFGWISF